MKVQFKNGTEMSCTAPIEQKIFKNADAAGWLLLLNLTQELTSVELDEFIRDENIAEITFKSDATDEKASETLFRLTDYDKVTSVIIRHSEEEGKSKAEIQLTKGV